jgi:ATP-dependent DNA ligase
MNVVNLPVNPPILPMLARRVEDLPSGGDWIFEPKWDGFRALVFRDKEEVFIPSRDEKPLNRYFLSCSILSGVLCLPAACSMAKS